MKALSRRGLSVLETPVPICPTYVCKSCRHQALRRRIAQQQQSRQASSESIPFTEKIRRKLWGTDNPPGLKDPYGGPSFLERRRKAREVGASGTEAAELEQEQSEDGKMSLQPLKEPKEYVPATTWDGLAHVGSSDDWRDVKPTLKDLFDPFTGRYTRKAETRTEVVSCLHNAIVSVMACQAAERRTDFLSKLAPGEWYIEEIEEAVKNAQVVVGNDGVVSQIKYASPEAQSVVLNRLRSLPKDTSRAGENEFLFVQLATPSFYEVPNEDFLRVKLDLTDRTAFSILKRFSLLSGHRIPDPTLNRAKDYGAIVEYVLKELEPKPKKLAEALKSKENLANIPNLKILERRETPVDKEKEKGRWKVIEAELARRGLPVLGRPEA